MKSTSSFIFVFLIFTLVILANPEIEKTKKTVNIAGIVLKWAPKDLNKNFSRFESLVRKAAIKGADIICTSECFLDGYSIRDTGMSNEEFARYAANNNNSYIGKMKKLSRELKIYLITGVIEMDNERFFNSAVLFGPSGSILGRHRKNHLWGYENNKFTPGEGFPVFKTPIGNIGIMICYERNFPKVSEELKNNGADIIFCPAGGGFGDASDVVMSNRSIETGLPVIFVHPVEFLVTGSRGETLFRYLSGKELDDSGIEKPIGCFKIYTLDLYKVP